MKMKVFVLLFVLMSFNVTAMHRARVLVEHVRARPGIVVSVVTGVAVVAAVCEIERERAAERRRRELERMVNAKAHTLAFLKSLTGR